MVVKITLRETWDMANRGKGTALDMVRSLAVIGVAVAFMFAFSTQETPRFKVSPSEVAATVEAARKNTDFPVLQLVAVPEGWDANAAYLDPIPGTDDRWTFNLGYVTDDNEYFGIAATNSADLSAFIGGYLFGTDTGETRMIGGLEFAVYENEKQQMFLHEGTGKYPYAIVITGAGNPIDLEIFLNGLRTS